MGAHINSQGEFQSDKYPTCPPGKVPLSVKDSTAQDLLWKYAKRRRSIDVEFSDDLQTALLAAGFVPTQPDDLIKRAHDLAPKYDRGTGEATTCDLLLELADALEEAETTLAETEVLAATVCNCPGHAMTCPANPARRT